jgi:hypothetical protein
VEAELEKEKEEPREQLDLALKEGETIKVRLPWLSLALKGGETIKVRLPWLSVLRPILTSPLGANFDPRGGVVPQG